MDDVHPVASMRWQEPRTPLVMGVAIGYRLPTFQTFVLTLRRHYDGEATLIVNRSKMAQGARISQFCRFHNITLLNSKTTLRRDLHVGHSRHEAFARLCHRADHICLAVDFRDSVFQANPFEGLLKSSTLPDLMLQMEGDASWPHLNMTLGRRSKQWQWVSECYDNRTAEQMRHWTTLCAGTMLGTSRGFRAVADGFLQQESERSLAMCNDQAIYNWLVWKGRLNVSLELQPIGTPPVLTAATFYKNPGVTLDWLPLRNDGILRNLDGTPAAVVHQYDRLLGAPVGYTLEAITWAQRAVAIREGALAGGAQVQRTPVATRAKAIIIAGKVGETQSDESWAKDHRPACMPYCHRNNSTWSTKCRWRHKCAECRECEVQTHPSHKEPTS